MSPPPPTAKCIQGSESEALNKGEEGEKRLEVRSVALSLFCGSHRTEKVVGDECVKMNGYGQEVFKIILINIYQSICQENLWALLMITGTGGFEFISPYSWWYQQSETIKVEGKVMQKSELRTSLVVRWLGIWLPMQGTRVWSLVWEDPTCRGATASKHHSYWAVHHSYWARAPQLLSPHAATTETSTP